MTGFKIAAPLLGYTRDACPGLFRRLRGFEIGDAQPGKLLARIPQLPVGRFVEFQKPCRCRVNNDYAVGRMLEQQTIADFGVALRLLRPPLLGDIRSEEHTSELPSRQ